MNHVKKINILIITAHPSSQGYTHKAAAAYKEGAEKAGHTIKVLDLYKTEHGQDYLNFENDKQWPDDPARSKLQEMLAWADEWVFIFPIWWGDCPAIMKNFLDMNMTSGFAFRRGKGLLKGKTARVFCTHDGPKIFYILTQSPKFDWKIVRMRYSGIKLKSFTLIGKKDRTQERTLNRIRRMGEKTR